MLKIIFSIILIYCLYVAAGFIMQRRVIFARHATDYNPAAEQQFGRLAVWEIDTEEGKSTAWFLPALNGDPSEKSPAVMFAGGNADLAQHWASRLEPYRRAGIHVLIPEYRGYGRSIGNPTQKSIMNDTKEFYKILSGRQDVDSSAIFFHGRSLGGGVVCSLSKTKRPEALILSSTFTSVKAMAWNFLFPPFLIKDPFDNLKALRRYDGPVLILHGREDELIPLKHAEKLKANAKDAILKELPGGHNNLTPYAAGGEAWSHIFSFLSREKIIEKTYH